MVALEKPENNAVEEETKECPTTLMDLGRGAMRVQNYSEAADFLVKSCQRFDEEYGKCNIACADVYALYGECLLELSRASNNPLADAVPEVIEEDEDEEENAEEMEDEVEGEEAEVKDTATHENGSTEMESKVNEVSEATEKTPTSVETADAKSDVPNVSQTPENASEVPEKTDKQTTKDQPSCSEAPNEDEEQDDIDHDSTYWVAIEWLTSAKTVYLENSSPENDIKAANCYLHLASLAVEFCSDLKNGLEDLQEALRLKAKHLPAHDKQIAEIHYMFGTYLEAANQFEKAKSAFDLCVRLLERELQCLENDGSTDAQRESVEKLVKEVKLRLDDLMLSKDSDMDDVRKCLVNEPALNKKPAESVVVNEIQVKRRSAGTEKRHLIEKENEEPAEKMQRTE